MNPTVHRPVLVLLAVLLAVAGAFSAPADDDGSEVRTAGRAAAKRTVLWISIDGVRPDYVDRGDTPTIDKLMREGAYTRELVPVFPSLTFPSHASQATGVKVREHGIPANSFIDIERERTYRYPPWASMLRAEPIWMTAARQGVRVAVYDWPLSHAQSDRGSRVTTEYFGERYEGRLTDRERIHVLLEAWGRDEKRGDPRQNPPLRLLMGYLVGPDSVGHQFGPDAQAPVTRLEETDQLLSEVIGQALAIWRRDTKSRKDEELWIILTTDHGMSAVHTLVHIGHLAALQNVDDVETVTSGNIAQLFFRDRQIQKNDPDRVTSMIERINAHDFASAWRRSDLPPEWDYAHPTRTGDIVIVLDTGYTFSARPDSVTAAATFTNGPLGMHGYDPRTNQEMNGLMVVWRHPEPLSPPNRGGIDLRRVHSLQLHATVAQLLGIEPAKNARRDAIDFESAAR